ncbi:MAG: response regulator [Candidatus Omnitrophota bacterium]
MKKKILVVEDDPNIRAILAARLVAIGFSVLLATDGRSGLELARKELPDIILLDLMLPEIDGYKVCRMIKFDTTLEHIRVIICSARATDADKKLAEQSGADAYLVKPFDVKLFVETAQKLLGISPSNGTDWLEKSDS